LDQWCQQAANGDRQQFQRRLDQDGWEEHRLTHWLGEVLWPQDLPVPDWCETIRNVFAPVPYWPTEKTRQFLATTSHYPFQALARPWVDHAENDLGILRHGLPGKLQAGAWDEALNYLTRLLSLHAAPVWHLEFTVWCSRHESSLDRAIRQARNLTSTRLYQAFLSHVLDGQWHPFLHTYPVLARQLAQITRQWSASVKEWVGRLQEDWHLLLQSFPTLVNAGPIQRIDLGLSDRHQGGRTTALLHFESGSKLIYKPKALDSDEVLAGMVDWVNSKHQLLPWKTVRTLNRHTHGWQEFLQRRPCDTPDGAREFYVRMGYLLGLVYVLEGYDAHQENLIADGSHPYLIDTETLFNPYREMASVASGRMDAAVMASQQVVYSVLRTGLLPSWQVSVGGERRDTSGLGGGDPTANDPCQVWRWRKLGTDDIHREAEWEKPRPKENFPLLPDGQPARAEDHVQDLRHGFAAFYRLLLNHRQEHLDRVRHWVGLRLRYVHRATRVYTDELQHLTQPHFLRDGLQWSLESERLCRRFLASDHTDARAWQLLRWEVDSLMQAEVPYFQVGTGSRDIETAHASPVFPEYFTRTCLERLADKTRMLGEDDLRLQDRFLVYAFHAKAARHLHDVVEVDAPSPPSTTAESNDSVSVQKEALAAARAIGDELISESLLAVDGSRTWIALEYLKESAVFQFKPISYNLYSGGMGVAVFLTALGRVTGDERYQQAARATLQPLTRILREEPGQVIANSGLGIGVGLGSLIYGLATIAGILGNGAESSHLIHLAQAALATVNPQTLATDAKRDLMFGTTGLILATAKLARVTGDADLVPAMTAMGRHLMSAADREGRIPTFQGRVITGFSHGAAGVALALARLYQHTADPLWLQAASCQIDFEENLYQPEPGNYPDYRSRPGNPAYLTTWCHGAPGIGLSRWIVYTITGDARLLTQVDRCRATTERVPLHHLDHLCCGNFGRLDIRLLHARASDDPVQLNGIARDTRVLLQRWRQTGGFRLFLHTPTPVFSPGLFVGASGIAYTLLRLAGCEDLPSVLAFQ
jgi:type 2 lantibiotic biosynthesis protein LanM